MASQAQSYRLQQGFETTSAQNELLYTVGATDPGSVATGTLGAATTTNTNAAPKTSNVYSEGSQAWGVVNNTGGGTTTSVLTFNNTTFATGSSSNFFRFRLASYQTNNNGGIDNGSAGVLVSIAYNGSTTFVPTLRINGQANGSVFNYTGTGVAGATINTTSPTLATVTSPNDLTGSGQGTSLTGTGGYSTASISFGSTITQIQVQISLIANGKTALYIDDVVIGSNSPLPVELTSFSAARQSGAVFLQWVTASEKNNDRFEVQRSADGQVYSTIKSVRGAGTTDKATSYSSKDPEPLSGVSYYRLQQIDQDGQTSYSPVRVVGAVLAVAYPSPTYDQLNLPATMVGTPYRVFNTLGQTLLEGKVSAQGAINVQNLRSGGYFLEVGSGKERVTQRFARE
ncbi:T9SS type A sorting domain-containing protein [Hymenobacter chitinivorans]|uniref:T9SS type A sorting domain-containing protein n=1 Tax=Hymenobacter chitinivorans TaxID=89969 RepID=UPI0012FD1337|nr:T9SS type A sorting domain-containing protein [Hymenobacter chitinivorans]